MLQMGGDMNELMSTKTCSPMMIYLAVLVTSGLSVYVTRNNLKRHNTVKMDNLYNMYTLNELKFMIVFGIILYGLCQYNKSTLAWVFLIFPVIYLLIQNLIIHIHVSSALQNTPKEIDLSQVQHMQAHMGGGQVIPQDTQQQPKHIMMPPPKSTEMPVTSSVSQQLGGSNSFNGSPISGSPGFGGTGSDGMSNYAYF